MSIAAPKPLSPLDSLFLWGERRETMMHVAGLLQFSPPPGADITYLQDLVHEAQSIPRNEVKSPWNRKLDADGLLPNPFRNWVTAEDIDLEYHVRHSALPRPGGERQLGVLVSRLHSNALDMTRPPWELHFIEGLENGRFAVYIKIHHSLVDGYSAMKLLVASLSETVEDMAKPLFFANGLPPRSHSANGSSNGDGGSSNLLPDIVKAVGSARAHTSSALTLTRRVAAPLIPFGKRHPDLVSGVRAPNSILNDRIGRNRRFATQQYRLSEIKTLANHFDVTLNDIFLSIVGGGLHRFLGELGALPKKSLVAFLPVNIRTHDDHGGGNALGAILAKVGSNIEDPVVRLRLVNASAGAAKAQLEGMTKQGIMAYSAYVMAPTGLQGIGAMVGLRTGVPINFNLCVSNVPGPREYLYLRGSRLEASYPVSIPYHSMALNITLQSYADTVGIGFVGCRDTLPHLQRLAVYTGNSLRELMAAAGMDQSGPEAA